VVGNGQARFPRLPAGHQYLDHAARSRPGVHVCYLDAAVSAPRLPPTRTSAATSHSRPVMRRSDGGKAMSSLDAPKSAVPTKGSRRSRDIPLANAATGWYSWMRPPSTSCRVTLADGGGIRASRRSASPEAQLGFWRPTISENTPGKRTEPAFLGHSSRETKGTRRHSPSSSNQYGCSRDPSRERCGSETLAAMGRASRPVAGI
jgi:hypothetical protein